MAFGDSIYLQHDGTEAVRSIVYRVLVLSSVTRMVEQRGPDSQRKWSFRDPQPRLKAWRNQDGGPGRSL